MNWRLSHRADPTALPLANRHYNRQHPDSPQFVPPGRCLVLVAGDPASALWVSSWPFAEYTHHAWAGAWVNSLFRREAGPPASQLIREAMAATRAYWGDPPPLGMITFIDRDCVTPTKRRGQDVWGWTYQQAGWAVAGESKGGLLCLQAREFPPGELALGGQAGLFG